MKPIPADRLDRFSKCVQQQLVLDVGTMAADIRMPFDLPPDVLFEMAYDYAHHEYVARLRYMMLYYPSEINLDEHICDVPETWWDAFKLRFFPVWLLSRFPAKLRAIRFTFKRALKAYFPTLPANQNRFRHIYQIEPQ